MELTLHGVTQIHAEIEEHHVPKDGHSFATKTLTIKTNEQELVIRLFAAEYAFDEPVTMKKLVQSLDIVSLNNLQALIEENPHA